MLDAPFRESDGAPMHPEDALGEMDRYMCTWRVISGMETTASNLTPFFLEASSTLTDQWTRFHAAVSEWFEAHQKELGDKL